MKLVLNRKQIAKLTEIVDHFHEVELFTIETDYSSGIGVGISVGFDLFKLKDTKIDITDLESW